MDDKRTSHLLGRRQTFHLIGVGLAAGGLFGLAACSKEKEAPPSGSSGGGSTPSPTPTTAPAETAAAGGTCDTPIDAASKQTRMLVQYKNPAAVAEKHCSVCSQYITAKFGSCGGCKLFAGPVQPNGGCASFAPIDPNAPPAKAG